MYQYTSFVWPMLASAAFMGVLGIYVWRRRAVTGALPLGVALILTSGMVTAAAILVETADRNPSAPTGATVLAMTVTATMYALVRVIVADNGCGFDRKRIASAGDDRLDLEFIRDRMCRWATA